MSPIYRIVRRAYSTYTPVVDLFTGTYVRACDEAARLQTKHQDGEYLVRRLDQPDWEPTSSHQSGMDWL